MTRDDLSRRLFEVTDEIASLDWTDDALQALHRAFSAEMSREVRALAELEPLPVHCRRPARLTSPDTHRRARPRIRRDVGRLVHALVAMDLPAPGRALRDWKFTAPVYIGDIITAEAEILSVHASKPVTGLRCAHHAQRCNDRSGRRGVVRRGVSFAKPA